MFTFGLLAPATLLDKLIGGLFSFLGKFLGGNSMSGIQIPVQFKGYWRDVNSWAMPNYSGVYVVYASTNCWWDNTVDLRRIIYIGEAKDVSHRIRTHERKQDWRSYLRYGEELAYAVSQVPAHVRLRTEAALIHRHSPPANVEFTLYFPFDETRVLVTGESFALRSDFVVERTALPNLYPMPPHLSPYFGALFGYSRK
jgi:hypothetical protein